MKIRFLVVALLFTEGFAQPKDGTLDVGGYLKYLISLSNVPATGDRTDHLMHGRLNLKWYANEAITAAAEMRIRAYAGGTVEKTPDFVDLIRTPREFGRLDAVLWNSRSSVGYAEVDRLWADWNTGSWQVTLGRQRVAMGTNLVWNPTDLFNPYSILDFDYEERPGFDGGRVQYYFGPLSKVELSVKPSKSVSTMTTAAALTTNALEYDFHMLIARRGKLWAWGGSWAGDIAGGGFRGEILASQKAKQTPLGSIDFSTAEGVMASAALSGDYTFPNSIYLHVETMYNSAGVTHDAALFTQEATSLGLLSPARWSLFAEVSYDITPLVRGSVFTLQNPVDGSRVYVPMVTWSVLTNVDLSVTALIFRGNALTEFGGYGESGYLRVKFSF
jgi:hypothetical protein